MKDRADEAEKRAETLATKELAAAIDAGMEAVRQRDLVAKSCTAAIKEIAKQLDHAKQRADAAEAELSRIKGAILAESLQGAADRHAEISRNFPHLLQEVGPWLDRATLIDAVRVLTARTDILATGLLLHIEALENNTDETRLAASTWRLDHGHSIGKGW